MTYLIRKYNRPGNVIFISSYPEQKSRYSPNVCAVSGFTKNTIDSLKKLYAKNSYIVLTMKSGADDRYEEDRVLVDRVFERNNPFSYLNLAREVLRFGKVKKVVIEFEFGSFGNIAVAAFFIFIPLLLKLLGKKQIIVIHQVIENLDDLSGHLGWKKNDIRVLLFNPLLSIFYKTLVYLADKIVVTEEVFKRKLKKIAGGDQKIAVISHGVDTNVRELDRLKSRKTLGIAKNKFVVLYFGYLTWYKGADFLARSAKKTRDKSLLFLLAGGQSFSNKAKSHYQRYLDNFKALPKNIRLTGFIPEDKISLYYGAADLVVFPYRTMMSSSGPLSFAFSYAKAVLLSEKLHPYLYSADFAESLKKAKVKPADLYFNFKFGGLKKKINQLKKNKLILFSKLIRRKRNYLKVTKKLTFLLT
ncbi:glycosyltransferase [Candidatus Roizmanbacteria bacterium]|nr:glycosyltransferase [Candidatus Roizmanbacteria bacterium]